MTQFLTTLSPIQLAITIGLFELFLSEAYKLTSKLSSSWQRRSQLYHENEYVVGPQRYKFLSKVVIVQLLLLILCVWLELSISSDTFPSSQLVDERCFKTDRQTRAVARGGPKEAELLDERIEPYVKKAGCRNQLFRQALAGETATFRGYPQCKNEYERRNISEILLLQGSNIAHVANSGRGDPHLAYGLASKDGTIIDEDHGDDRARSLATTSFWMILFGSHNLTTNFWSFGESMSDQRIATNVEIPEELIENAPTEDNFSVRQKGSVNCPHNDLKCYHDYAVKAHSLDTIDDSLLENRTAVLIRSHRSDNGLVPSAICIFDKSQVKIEVSWVFMSQEIASSEERNRSGPAITQIRITGNESLCLKNVPRIMSRLYFDAMESISLRTMLENEDKINPKLNMYNKVVGILNKAAVVMGMNTLELEKESSECKARYMESGSSIGRVETIISFVYISLVLLIMLIEILSTIRNRKHSPIFVDPLDTRELLEQIIATGFQGNPSETSEQFEAGIDNTQERKGKILEVSSSSNSYSIRLYQTPPTYRIKVQRRHEPQHSV